MQDSVNKLDIDSFWEYADPAASEERFRQALDSAAGDERLELLTQIARTYGLRGIFDQAHSLLDEVEAQLEDAGARPSVRYLLERGRAFNSGGDVKRARPLFSKAWDLAYASGLEGLAVDAAHMVAITYSGGEQAIAWNQRGLEMARTSTDPKAQALIPAMLNNSAWDLHDLGHLAEAMASFVEALAEWSQRGKVEQTRIAKWSIARCLRSLGQYEPALEIIKRLEAEHAAAGSVDGYVFEELAENLAALGKPDQAKPYFGKAFAELSQDDWLVQNEPDRLASLEARAL